MFEGTSCIWLVKTLPCSYESLNKILHQVWENSYEFLVKEALDIHKIMALCCCPWLPTRTRQDPDAEVIHRTPW